MVIAGSAPRRFFLFGRHANFQRGGGRFPGKSRSGPSKVTTPAPAASSLWAMDRCLEARKQRLFPRPLPIIGVRRVVMQCRAHDDDDRAAPAVAPAAAFGPEIPMASAFQPPTPEQGVFSRGRDVGGLVDSWSESLVPSASNRSTPEWTPVDSVDSRQGLLDDERLRARVPLPRGAARIGR